MIITSFWPNYLRYYLKYLFVVKSIYSCSFRSIASVPCLSTFSSHPGSCVLFGPALLAPCILGLRSGCFASGVGRRHAGLVCSGWSQPVYLGLWLICHSCSSKSSGFELVKDVFCIWTRGKAWSHFEACTPSKISNLGWSCQDSTKSWRWGSKKGRPASSYRLSKQAPQSDTSCQRQPVGTSWPNRLASTSPLTNYFAPQLTCSVVWNL